MIVAVYPGSFDPMTLGHVDITTRAGQLFDRVILGVARETGPHKPGRIPFKQRFSLVQEAVAHLSNVSVEPYEKLTVSFAKEHNARIIIRGLRAVSDFDYEFTLSQMNRHLAPEIETVFLMAGLEYQFLSSSMVTEVARLGGDVSALVPAAVANAILN